MLTFCFKNMYSYENNRLKIQEQEPISSILA